MRPRKSNVMALNVFHIFVFYVSAIRYQIAEPSCWRSYSVMAAVCLCLKSCHICEYHGCHLKCQ